MPDILHKHFKYLSSKFCQLSSIYTTALLFQRPLRQRQMFANER